LKPPTFDPVEVPPTPPVRGGVGDINEFMLFPLIPKPEFELKDPLVGIGAWGFPGGCMAPLFLKAMGIASPGGAASPGGGPLTVENI
jgi:hypothetical protein